MINTMVTDGQLAGFGMSSMTHVSGRTRALPMRLAAPAATAAGQKCVLIPATAGAGYRQVTTVVEGAFPGPSAWSPPI